MIDSSPMQNPMFPLFNKPKMRKKGIGLVFMLGDNAALASAVPTTPVLELGVEQGDGGRAR